MANDKSILISTESYEEMLQGKSGPLEYRLTNDYLFRASLQKNKIMCKGLICAFLNLEPETIRELYITNPIELGEAMDDKTCILDVKIIFNDNTILNIEVQIRNQGDWPDRSLTYLCKSFDQLEKGAEYTEIKTTIHIGILEFTPIPENPEFYAKYMLMDSITHKIYSSKMVLCVLDLSQIDSVTEEQKKSKMYYWAKLFKATSWEEIRMLAKNDEAIKETVFTLMELSEDDKIKLQCEARERYDRDMASYRTYCRKEGMKEGREEGEMLKIISLVAKKEKKGMEAAEIADILEEPTNYIEPIFQAIISNRTASPKEIYQILCKK